MQTLRSIKSQVYFVLQLGYFKAKHQFFTFDLHEVMEDLQYVLEQHFDNSKIADLNQINRFTRLKQQYLILELFDYCDCNAKERQKIMLRAHKTVAVCSKPVYIFREIIHYFHEQRIVAPGYSSMQKMVSEALTYEQNRLTAIMQDHLKQSDIEALKQLLEDSPGLYEITQLRREPKDFSVSEIKREIDRCKKIQPLYQIIQRLLPKLNISNESVKYYSSLVDYYSVYKLKKLNKWIVYVYLLCFIYHRYQQAHDNLIETLIYNIRRFVDETKFTAKERVYECYTENNQNMKKAGQVLKIFTDNSIATNTPFQDIQARAFSILERKKLMTVADQIASDAKFDETAFQWEHVDKLARSFKRHLRPILLMVDFVSSLTNDPLVEAINFMKLAFIKNRPLGQYPPNILPSQFISDSIKRYLYRQNVDEQKTLLVDRYEFLVYRLLRNSLEAGDIFCRESIRFRSLEDDLLDEQQWQQKDKLIADVGLFILNQPIKDHLAELEHRFESRIAEVNRRISAGENEHLQIKKRGSRSRWTLQPEFDSLIFMLKDCFHIRWNDK